MKDIRLGVIGTGFAGGLHASSIKYVPNADIVAVSSRSQASAEAFQKKYGIENAVSPIEAIFERDDLDGIIICVPNDLHADLVCAAAEAGKHVMIEKPLCRTLAEADRMIAARNKHGVVMFYAENLCFTPKYVRAKKLVDEGAVGDVYLVKQSEKHFGPHSDWFWDVERSGGGVFLDMGCHGIEFARWILGKLPVTSIYCDLATLVHGDKTEGDDNSVAIITFEGGARAIIEDSWARRGGMDDVSEIYGAEGVIYADLCHGNSLRTYSEQGYGYAIEKASTTAGWTFSIFEEEWQYGYPGELAHFVDCIRGNATPVETLEDGRVVLEIILAGYESAREGRVVTFPYAANLNAAPVDVWRGK